MDYILGLLTGVVFLIALGAAFYIGTQAGQKKKPTPAPVNEDEKQRIKKLNQHFQNIFNYDVDVAYGKKVNE